MPTKFLMNDLRRAPGKRAPACADARDASLCSGKGGASPKPFSHRGRGPRTAACRHDTAALLDGQGNDGGKPVAPCVGGNNPPPPNSQVQACPKFSHGRTYAAPSSPGHCCRPRGRLCDELSGPKQSPPPKLRPPHGALQPAAGTLTLPAQEGNLRPDGSDQGPRRPLGAPR